MNQNDTKAEYLSRERFDELQNRLHELKTTKRMEIAKHLEYAKELGDLSENAEYAEAKEEQMANEAEIIKLEYLLAHAQIIANTQSEEVRVGSTVSFTSKAGDKEQQFVIVGSEEANPLAGKISYESPLGKAFLGRKKNEKILVTTPKGQVEYKILNIA